MKAGRIKALGVTTAQRSPEMPEVSTEPSSVPLGDAHRAVIDERLAEHERNPDDVVSRDEVLAEARRG